MDVLKWWERRKIYGVVLKKIWRWYQLSEGRASSGKTHLLMFVYFFWSKSSTMVGEHLVNQVCIRKLSLRKLFIHKKKNKDKWMGIYCTLLILSSLKAFWKMKLEVTETNKYGNTQKIQNTAYRVFQAFPVMRPFSYRKKNSYSRFPTQLCNFKIQKNLLSIHLTTKTNIHLKIPFLPSAHKKLSNDLYHHYLYLSAHNTFT